MTTAHITLVFCAGFLALPNRVVVKVGGRVCVFFNVLCDASVDARFFCSPAHLTVARQMLWMLLQMFESTLRTATSAAALTSTMVHDANAFERVARLLRMVGDVPSSNAAAALAAAHRRQ
jgi:hypothetical protein